MNKTRYLILTISILIFMMACSLGQAVANVREQIADVAPGSGNVVEENRPIEGFSSIDLAGLGDVQIQFGDREALSIEAEDNIIGLIETQNRGSTLVIGIAEDVNILPTEPIRIYVTAVDLESISVSGAGSVNVDEIFSESFEVVIEGLGSTDIGELKTENLTVSLEGSGGITIDRGEALNQSVVIEGLGNYDGGGLESGTADVEISGAGNATVWATDRLEVTISGLGNVNYYGDPSVSLNREGLGNINSLGNK